MTCGSAGRWLLPTFLAGLAGCDASYRLEGPPPTPRTQRAVLTVRWFKDLSPPSFLDYKPQQFASASISPEGVIFVGSTSRRFEAYRGSDGLLLWHIETGGPVSSTPLYHPQSRTVFFGADDGKMYAADARTGKVRWSYTTQGTINRPPACREGFLLFTTSEGRIYAIDARTGKWRWQYDRETPEGFTIRGYSGVAVEKDVAYVGFADGVLVALRAFSGDVVWTRSLAGSKKEFVDIDVTPVISGELLYTSCYATGVHALFRETGSIRWQFAAEGVTGLEVGGDRIYVAAPRNGLFALDLAGRQLWRQALARGVPHGPLRVGPFLFVSSTETGLFVASARSGQLLQRFDLGWGVSASPAAGAGLLVVLSNGGSLFAFGLPATRAGRS